MQSLYYPSTLPEIKGYRILQKVHNDEQQNSLKQTMIKISVENSYNGVPRIRHDVICHGKLYQFIPLFTFTSQDDLRIFEQLSAIVLKDENQILCDILSKKITQVKSSQFQDLKERIKNIFGLQLKIQHEQLFLIVISQQISSETQFNVIMDSISETEFVSLIKKIYQNCNKRLIPRLLRKFNKYFNSAKTRSPSSIQRLKKYLKIVKTSQDDTNAQYQEEDVKQEDQYPVYKEQNKKTQKVQYKTEKKQQQKPLKTQSKQSAQQQAQKPVKKQSIKQKQTITKKTTQTTNIIKQTQQKIVQKQIKNPLKDSRSKKSIKTQPVQDIKKISPVKDNQKSAKIQQKQQDWKDVDQSSDDNDIQESIDNMAYHQSDEDQEGINYHGPKKKNNKKAKGNITIPIDPQFQGKKQQRSRKQKDYKNNSNSNNYNSNSSRKNISGNRNNGGNAPVKDNAQTPQQKLNGRSNNRYRNNGGNNNSGEQSAQRGQRGGRRDYSKQNKKTDPRILFGINGASDSVWREKMRPVRIPKQQNNYNRRLYQNNDRRQNRNSKTEKSNNQSLIVTKITDKQSEGNKKNNNPNAPAKNLTLQRVFCIPEDVQKGKTFLFQNRSYNIFVNKLFWVNISQGQLTIQKEGKGYIRKCNVQIIDGGKGIMAQGLTLNIEGVSNLQDGGTPFGDPVFQQFTPEGQWFHISSLQVYAYM